MTCVEFQEVLPDIMEGQRNAEHEAHLHSCSVCSGLVSDLNLISEQARFLQASEEPSPRVWNRLMWPLSAAALWPRRFRPGRVRSVAAWPFEAVAP